MHLTCLPYVPRAQLTLLDFSTRVIIGEEYRTLSSSLRSLLSPATSTLVSPILYKSRSIFPSQCETKFYTNTKQEANYSSAHMNIYIFGSETKKGIWKIHVFQTAIQPPIVPGLLQTVPHHHCPLSDPFNTSDRLLLLQH